MPDHLSLASHRLCLKSSRTRQSQFPRSSTLTKVCYLSPVSCHHRNNLLTTFLLQRRAPILCPRSATLTTRMRSAGHCSMTRWPSTSCTRASGSSPPTVTHSRMSSRRSSRRKSPLRSHRLGKEGKGMEWNCEGLVEYTLMTGYASMLIRKYAINKCISLAVK